MTNFSEYLCEQATKYGDDRYYIFLNGKPDAGGHDKRSYAMLNRGARSLAVWLSQHERARHPVLLLYPEGLDFLQAFLGCIHAGVIAVPAPLPNGPKKSERLINIIKDGDIRLVLTTTEFVTRLREELHAAGIGHDVQCEVTDVDIGSNDYRWVPPQVDVSSIAFLQYTSGSTSDPKGVMVSHGNLLHNQEQIRQVTCSDQHSVLVGWLPHFHDMGLIGMLMHPLYVGGNCVFMSPASFLKRPLRWLEAISHFRATLTVAPDFAYQLCARTISDEQLMQLNLSPLKIALNGAEPVRAHTLEKFTQRFRQVGFTARTFSPCYGMAEVTLLATGSRAGAHPVFYDADAQALEQHQARPAKANQVNVSQIDLPKKVRRLVSSGRVVDLDLRIVDCHSFSVLADGQVGEIWLRGGSVAQGYWNNAKATKDSFQANTAEGEGPYLRTGDLGFVQDGELFVTGRLKDILIVNGRNLYPQDIEHTINTLHPALTSGSCAVFMVESQGNEYVVVVQEVKEVQLDGLSLAQLAQLIQDAITREFGVSSPSVLLTNRGNVPRTTSGKVQRNLMRHLFLTGQVPALYQDIAADWMPVPRDKVVLEVAGSSIATVTPKLTTAIEL